MRNPITGEIKRVDETEARRLARYQWTYVSKAVWKQSIRPDYKAIREKAKEVVEDKIKPVRRP